MLIWPGRRVPWMNGGETEAIAPKTLAEPARRAERLARGGRSDGGSRIALTYGFTLGPDEGHSHSLHYPVLSVVVEVEVIF